MSAFKIKENLPQATRDEIDRISAIPSAQRLQSEADFLTALAPYLVNEVISYDADGLILQASGTTLPTGDSGFIKGAIFIKTDASGNGFYINTGTSSSAVWNLSDQASTADIPDGAVTADKLATTLDLTGKDIKFSVKEGTPVNAVASSKVLTVGGLPSEGDTVTIGAKTYKFRGALGAGAKATKTLTFTDVAIDGETVTVDTDVYEFVDALTEAKASGVLTLTGNPTDGNSITIGEVTYTFRETLAEAYDVKIGADASTTIDNLILAITAGAGAGTNYGTGTVAHPDVTATAGAGDTMNVTAKEIGVAGNSIATTELGAVASWASANLGGGADAVANEVLIGTAEQCIDRLIVAVTGGAGEGTVYSTGTVANTTVDVAKADTDKFVATAKSVGFAGNSIAIAEDLTNASWAGGATALSGGVDAQSANDVLIGVSAEACIDNLVLAVTAGSGAGTNYGTGTTVNADATAVKASASTMTATAKVKGVSGNSIAIAESGTNLTWAGGATFLSGGVDGTVGDAYEIYADSTYLYVASASNTISGANWRRVALGSAY